MRYGIYYRGSKNEIAESIISFLPSSEYFIDMFGGGGAITHAAALSHKYKYIIYNDNDTQTMQLIKDAIEGKYDNEMRWISSEEFFNKRKEDGYIKLCWSFGNNGRGYIYGKNIEKLKEGMWKYIYNNDSSILLSLGYTNLPTLTGNTSKKRRVQLYPTIKAKEGKTVQLESALCLERLQSLSKWHFNNISFLSQDYTDVSIPENSVIYCDPPYKNSTEDNYSGEFSRNSFNYSQFYNWAKKQRNIYISEYDMPDDFSCVWKDEKVIHSTKGTHMFKQEKLFIPNV